MYVLELFAGAGGGILGHLLLGHTVVGAVEIGGACRSLLLERQRDFALPLFPVWDDVRTFRADNPECADYIGWLRSIGEDLCVAGGFPCQNVSCSGPGGGVNGEKSGLWREMARIVGEIEPAAVFAENSPLLASRGLDVVLQDLASMGYDARWCTLGGGHLGYPTKRDRIWILGEHHRDHGRVFDAGQQPRCDYAKLLWSDAELGPLEDADKARLLAHGLAAGAPDGVAGRVESARAVGNGQIPAVAALAWGILTGDIRQAAAARAGETAADEKTAEAA